MDFVADHTMNDTILEIDRRDWPKLRDLYSPNSFDTFLGYCIVDNFIRCSEKKTDPEGLHIYCLNGDWSDGTFVASDSYYLFVDSLNATNDHLYRLLHLMKYAQNTRFAHIRSKHQATIHTVLDSRALHKAYECPTLLYRLANDKALNVNVTIPDGIHLRSLTDTECEAVNEAWSYRHRGTLSMLRQLASFNPNVGAFNGNGEMLAWVFQLRGGPIGVLQVSENSRGLGLGTVLCRVISKEIARKGQDVSACVMDDNHASRRIFEKIGFEVVDKTFWILGSTNISRSMNWTDE